MSTHRPLAGRVVVTTRDQRGPLDSMLAARGADVVHVPLIAIESSVTQRHELGQALADLTRDDWIVVTSRHGAAACGGLLADCEARLAAVGTATAIALERVAERPVDVVPVQQHAAALAEAMPGGSARLVLAQADRADNTLAEALAQRGYDVSVITAYSNVRRSPSAAESAAAGCADAVAFASGSAAESWVAAFGVSAPPVIAAMGPTTAAAAERAGLTVTVVAETHDVVGLAEAVTSGLRQTP